MPGLAGLLWAHLPASSPWRSAARLSVRQGTARDGASVFRGDLRYGHRDIAGLGDAIPQGPQPAADTRRSAVHCRVPASCPGRPDGDLAAQAFDRHGTPARRPHHIGAVVVAVAGTDDAATDGAR